MTTTTDKLAQALRRTQPQIRHLRQALEKAGRVVAAQDRAAVEQEIVAALAEYDAQQAAPVAAGAHTPEPWAVGFSDGSGETYITAGDHPALRKAEESVVVVVSGAEDDWGVRQGVRKPEDAARIVACVNACAGIATEALQSGTVARMLAQLEAPTDSAVTAFAANLRHAIWNRETVKVGGGLFSRAELEPVLAYLERAGGTA